MEWASNWCTKAAKHATAFAQHVSWAKAAKAAKHATAFVSHLWVDHNKQTEEGLNTGSQVAVDVSDVENPRSFLPDEVVSNGNAEVRDETVVDMPDTASLLPQTPVAAQAIRNPRNLPQGALLTVAKEVANRVTFISAGGLFSELSGVIGNEKAVLLHEYIFNAFIIFSYVSLSSGLALHLLIKIIPETRGFMKIVKFTIYFSQGTLVCAISCAICLMFPSKVGVDFILMVPLIPIGLVAVLRSTRRVLGSIP